MPITMMSFIVCMGLWPGPTPTPEGPVFLSAVNAPASVPAGAPVEVVITGNLPSPAYELIEPAVQRREHAVHIHLASHIVKTGPVIQVLVPFTRTVILTDLDVGHWTITVDAPSGEPLKAGVDVR